MKKSAVLLVMMLSACSTNSYAQDAYAILSANKKVLTFYYDEYKNSRNGMNVDGGNVGWSKQSKKIETVVFSDSFKDCVFLISTAGWFSSCENLKEIKGIENLRTDNVTDMASMFYGCSSLVNLDLSTFNTINVAGMGNMFYGCSSLTNLDISSFNTTNVTDMDCIFCECSSLINLDLSSFNTTNITNMSNMFFGCSSLTNLNISSFNTINVTTMYRMFEGCTSLTSLDLSCFDTHNVENMQHMFDGCRHLRTIFADESKWSTKKLDYYSRNFNGMFENCVSIMGGNGTRYDKNDTSGKYARIDKPGQDGYLTGKEADNIQDIGLTNENNNNKTYTLGGQKISFSHISNGVYIINGKKVLYKKK